jgi:hypothetical protein
VGPFAVGALALGRPVLPIQLDTHATIHIVGATEEVSAEERVTQQRQMHLRKSHQKQFIDPEVRNSNPAPPYSQCRYIAILYIQSHLISFVFLQALSKLHHSSIECIPASG